MEHFVSPRFTQAGEYRLQAKRWYFMSPVGNDGGGGGTWPGEEAGGKCPGGGKLRGESAGGGAPPDTTATTENIPDRSVVTGVAWNIQVLPPWWINAVGMAPMKINLTHITSGPNSRRNAQRVCSANFNYMSTTWKDTLLKESQRLVPNAYWQREIYVLQMQPLMVWMKTTVEQTSRIRVQDMRWERTAFHEFNITRNVFEKMLLVGQMVSR